VKRLGKTPTLGTLSLKNFGRIHNDTSTPHFFDTRSYTEHAGNRVMALAPDPKMRNTAPRPGSYFKVPYTMMIANIDPFESKD
jgi:hypothetical protein